MSPPFKPARRPASVATKTVRSGPTSLAQLMLSRSLRQITRTMTTQRGNKHTQFALDNFSASGASGELQFERDAPPTLREVTFERAQRPSEGCGA